MSTSSRMSYTAHRATVLAEIEHVASMVRADGLKLAAHRGSRSPDTTHASRSPIGLLVP